VVALGQATPLSTKVPETRAVLLGRPPAVAVGEGVGGPAQVVFEPLSVGRRRLGVEAEQAALDINTTLAVALELLADGGVVKPCVHGGHDRTGMAEKALDHVLRHPGIDNRVPSVCLSW